jgi:uncharacterized protein (TIGR02444 family)
MLRADPSGDMPFVENLWSFALATYQKPEVARLCLHWQDEFGADVNLLLTSAWLASQQKTWSEGVIFALERLCVNWRTYGVLPLRAGRRAVVSTELYPALKSLELRAEQLQITMIESWVLQSPLPVGSLLPAQCLNANLGAYIQSQPWAEIPGVDALQALITALNQ